MHSSSSRVLAVDALRGITIAAMILVNNPGSWSSVYWPLLHAEWHGWTPTDLIFPWFVFIVGVAAAYSLPRQLEKGASRVEVMQKACIRGAKLFGLGLFLAVFYYNFQAADYNWWQERIVGIRIPGVLQRIALVFVLTAPLVLWLGKRGLWAALVGCLAVYTLLMQLVAYQDAAGQQYVGQWLFGNSLSAWLDSTVLGASHLYYSQATPFAFDPEGLLSTLPAVGTCLSGVLTGYFLQSGRSKPGMAWQLAVLGLGSFLAGMALDPLVPINKALWTPSYVLLSSGLAMLALAALIAIMDVAGKTGWAKPFVICGANSIAFYMLAGVMARLLIMIPVGGSSLQGYLFDQLYAPLFGAYPGSLAFAVSFLIVSFIPIWWMYRKGIFWKV